MKFRDAVAATFVRQIAVLGIGIITVSMVSRSLGAEEYGRYALVLLSIFFAQTITSLSIPSTVIYYTERYRQVNELANLFGAAIIVQLSSLLIMFLLAIVAWTTNFMDVQRLGIKSFALLGALLLLQMGNSTLQSFWLGLRRYEWFNIMSLIQPLLFLSGILFFGEGIVGWVDVVFVYTIAVALTFFACTFVSKYVGLPWPRFSYKPITHILGYGRHMWTANVLSVANYRAQYFVIEHLLGLRVLGQYALANQFAEKLWLPGGAISTIIFPERAFLIGSSRHIRRQGLIFAFVNMLLVFLGVIVLYLFVFLFGEQIFGTDFTELPSVIMGLALGIVTWAGTKILAAELAGGGHSLDNALISLTSLVVGVLGLWIGSPFGGFGAAFGVSIGYTTGFLLALFLFLQMTGRQHNEQQTVTGISD